MGNKRFLEKEFYNEILFETENFKVIPSLGSLVEGWLLIIPREAYLNYSKITDPLLISELEDLINTVCDVVKNEYGEYILFEHGPIFEKSRIGCGVDHAHIHVVPVKLNLETVDSLADQKFIWNTVGNFKDISLYNESYLPYLYFQDNSRKSYIATSPEIPSQFFRRVIAKFTNQPESFDWKDNFFLENIINTYSKLSKYTPEFIS